MRSCGKTAVLPSVVAELTAAGHLPMVRERTGLVLDPYFTGTKFEWMLAHGGVADTDDLALGTIDSWLLWNLTGGEVHATDTSNASRTMLFNIHTLAWDDELCAILHVPRHALGQVRPSSGRFGLTQRRLRRPGRNSHLWHCWRPTKRALRPGLLSAGRSKKHLRHRELRPDECRAHLPATGGRDAHQRCVDARRWHDHIRARRCGVRDWGRNSMAA